MITLDIAASILTGYDDNGQAYAQTQLDAYQLTLACGADASEVIYYCLYRGDVLKASYFTAGFLLSQGYDGLLLGAPINVPTNRLTSLTLTRAAKRTCTRCRCTSACRPTINLKRTRTATFSTMCR